MVKISRYCESYCLFYWEDFQGCRGWVVKCWGWGGLQDLGGYFTLFFHPFHTQPSTFLTVKQAYKIVA